MPNLENKSVPDNDQTTTSEWVIRGTDIEKTYDSWLPFGRTVEVLTEATLTINESELVGIVGGNGSGKSTLMKILVGVLERDGGEVERRGTIGWCPQETLLYDRLTVRETMQLFGSGYGLDSATIRERQAWLADRFEYEEYLDTRVDHLSGGNQQKVNLSVALLHQPDVLLLDEPYTGFDWETYQTFWEFTDELAAQGTAIVVISHFVEEHDRFDRIYELQDGSLERQNVADSEEVS
ncbi:ABC-type multidrug transport system, ATPase component [Halovenus aranensis]|uniref:ABC-type multidrug transport system, ATPase component n=1 Tax=Halovenus aranensis TaxID=890420 RepID=A0A1G8S7U8_9EURY|nr:ABC transporter ATP-binding protein [Halovenus aranensis]SDJ25266.1 ABC-type multidrug transport system, ATPase component [Halovenus aranensis]